MSTPSTQGSTASRARASFSSPASTTNRAPSASTSPTGPPRTTKPWSTSSSMNAACASQLLCCRRVLASSQAGPRAVATTKYWPMVRAYEDAHQSPSRASGTFGVVGNATEKDLDGHSPASADREGYLDSSRFHRFLDDQTLSRKTLKTLGVSRASLRRASVGWLVPQSRRHLP